ncbi:Verru_Chthon cassette protein C [Phragmitibacter flavus]|uniref:Verru_Chthon cassette protein C n=1 Tax=Phragmitibacter flavus TaxID=2576071 RepID=A0A5R8K8A4_9BACT|nr:Verru_Chthon cassette protein C [Phragmitibacter flavus]TLD68543.1 Verru_Chthon cassette protein C [Phragmitibacter flavus]
MSRLRRHAFTLVELLISMTILSILFLIVVNVLSEVQRGWSQAGGKVSQFREARRAFDIIKFNLQQSTLNTYERLRFPNPADPLAPAFNSSTGAELDINLNPIGYVRYSELQFRTGPTTSVLSGASGISAATHPGHSLFFQAPLGYSSQYQHLPTAINGRGYYVEFGDDSTFRPPFIATSQPAKYRYRLMEYAPPTENNTIYNPEAATASNWMLNTTNWSRPIADNVLILIVSPKRITLTETTANPRDIAPGYTYDSAGTPISAAENFTQLPSDHQLPPAVELLMVVIDERSAANLAPTGAATPPFTFSGFTIANNDEFQADTNALEAYLVGQKVNFRIFSTTVPLRNSRWDD